MLPVSTKNQRVRYHDYIMVPTSQKGLRMSCWKMVITGVVLIIFLQTVRTSAEEPAKQAEQQQLSGEFLEFLGEIDSHESAGFNLRLFCELFQAMKTRLKDVIDSVSPQIDDENRKKENDNDSTQKN